MAGPVAAGLLVGVAAPGHHLGNKNAATTNAGLTDGRRQKEAAQFAHIKD